MKPVQVSCKIGGRTLTLETGYIAKQASGSVVASYGETSTFASVCTADPRPGLGFFPLSVEYREKLQAAGKFPGGFMKREGRPSTKEILTCRLIDRSARPMFPEGYKDEVQVISFVVQADGENDPDIIAMNAAFAALHLSQTPFVGPLGAVRVARINGEFVVNPEIAQVRESDLDLILSGSRDAIIMVEGACQEISEDDFISALDFAHGHIRGICDKMDELADKVGKVPVEYEAPEEEVHAVYDDVYDSYEARFSKALRTEGKHERSAACRALRDEAMAEFVPEGDEESDDKTAAVKLAWKDLEKELTREFIRKGFRVDGRKLDEIRPIHIKAGWQSRLHGSCVFTRGETQALVVATLGTLRDQQIVDGLGEEYSKKFDLQYNFPPYCVGEVKMIRGVSRREIGHGNLAERSLLPILPDPMTFPYTIRLISDILESNGSSSMASVCGGTLAMMDAGVPIKQPVAGIAMGLIKDEDDVFILSDILGSEDHHGDMDFKVAGTGRGITAVQMDIKVKGLSREIMARALEQARVGRLHILKKMMQAIARPAETISEFAPRLMIIKIPVEKIGLVIGPGGKMIKKLQEETGANVEIEDDGSVHISSTRGGQAEEAKRRIEMITAEVEIGQVYEGRVVSVKDFGVFVELLPGQEGLCHVSELSDEYVSNVGDVVSLGDVIKVKVVARDEQDRIKLSRKVLLEEEKSGEGSSEAPRRAGRDGGRPPRRDDGDRPPRRDAGDRPPRRDANDRPPRGDSADGGDDRPRRPRRDDDDRPARRPRRDDDERPPRRRESADGDDRPARRPQRDEDDRPARRPRRDDDERPPRRRESAERDDRPARRPQRDDDDRPARRPRSDDDDRPPRRRESADGDDRPRRSSSRDDDDRPRRRSSRDDERPARRESAGDDRPPRRSSRDDERPPRRDEGSSDEDRPRRTRRRVRRD